MRREDWDRKERLGWEGKIWIERKDWDVEGKLRWGGKTGMGRKLECGEKMRDGKKIELLYRLRFGPRKY